MFHLFIQHIINTIGTIDDLIEKYNEIIKKIEKYLLLEYKKLNVDIELKFKDVFNGVLILIIAALYVSLCALKLTDWGKFWVIFVYYPAITSLLEAIVYKDANKFATPVFCAAVYVTIGMYFDVWHPYWFIFFIIPIYHTIASAFKKKIKLYFYGKDNEKHTFNIFEGAIQVTHKK